MGQLPGLCLLVAGYLEVLVGGIANQPAQQAQRLSTLGAECRPIIVFAKFQVRFNGTRVDQGLSLLINHIGVSARPGPSLDTIHQCRERG